MATADRATEVAAAPSPPATTSSATLPLRVWPLVLLLALQAFCRLSPRLTTEPNFALFTLSVFGPMTIGVLMALWWLFASRASGRERWLGLLGLAVIIVGAQVLADKSLQGMSFAFYVLPTGIAAFGVAMLLASRLRTPVRTLIALAAAAIGFGAWDFARIDGMTGDFDPDLRWRGEPTQEDRYLAALAAPASRQTRDQSASAEPLDDPDWPQFRGPNRDAIVPDVVLETDWQAHPPRDVWKRKVGPGWSSFCVAGGRAFTQEQRGEVEVVVCYDAGAGSELWRNEIPVRFWETVGGAGPRATPTLAGSLLYTLGATGALQCLDPLTGNTIWKRELKVDAGREPPIWGFSSSPLVTAGAVIVHAGGTEDRGLLAYDAQTGEPKWHIAAGDHSYGSPHLLTVAGREVVAMLTNTGVLAVDPADGREVWSYAWPYNNYRVLQPLLVDGTGLLLGSGMGLGTRRVDIGVDGDDVKLTERWTSLDLKPDFNDFVAHKGYVYGFDHNLFECVDLATGKRKWKKGRYGNGQVLLLPDADQLLVLSETGEIILLKADPGELTELARHKALDGKTWNHPALAGNRLFVRNGEEAACVVLPQAP